MLWCNLLQDLQAQIRDLLNQYNDLTELHQQEVYPYFCKSIAKYILFGAQI